MKEMQPAADIEWIDILQCPISKKNLRALSVAEIEELQTRAAAGQLWHCNGTPMNGKIEKGLITTDGAYIYPIVHDVIELMQEYAIVKAMDKIVKSTFSDDKLLVKDFYDNTGWFADDDGHYGDAIIFEDLRPFAQEYIKRCHDRVNRFLPPSGTYMLDAASGALQSPDYLQYSAGYQYRVCVDFSRRALLECKKKLGAKALCIQADMTKMPFKDGVMDGFVSLNTIYHIPKDEQVTAIKELYRVLKQGGKGVVVYEWFKHSPWMNIALLPFRGFVFIKNRIMDSMARLAGKKDAGRRLYYYAHSPAYFKKQLPPYSLKVWRSISVHFMRYYLHAPLFGKQILQWIYNKEEKDPATCGLKGEYPMLVFEKK